MTDMSDEETTVATTYEVGKSVLLTRVAPRVIVESAPARSQIRLDVLQQSDSTLLWISGSTLHLGNDRRGREVIYRVTGWDSLSCTWTRRDGRSDMSRLDGEDIVVLGALLVFLLMIVAMVVGVVLTAPGGGCT